MPVAIALPGLGEGVYNVPSFLNNPDATVFLGIDPDEAFHLMELDFRDGSQDVAQKLLRDGKDVTLGEGVTPAGGDVTAGAGERAGVQRQGHQLRRGGPAYVLHGLVARRGDGYEVTLPRGEVRTCPAGTVEKVEDGRFLIVTNEFKELKKLVTGDPFPLKRKDGSEVVYTICGVVWSPGIDVFVAMYDLGQVFNRRTAASVFGTIREARRDFGVENIYIFAAEPRPGRRPRAVPRTREEGVEEPRPRRGGRAAHQGEDRQKGFYRLLHLASTVAFAAMLVASLGVTNTVMAGIRTRRWQFGVLRSIGVTRSQLLRLVLSEAVLLGLIACALGLAAGAVMSVDAHRLSVLTTGYAPPPDIPYGIISVGVGIVLFIALAASLWPAMHVAKAEPLTLLQAGRAAT